MLMPFGKYRGLPLSEVPPDYLAWLYWSSDIDGALRWEVEEALLAHFPARPTYSEAQRMADFARLKAVDETRRQVGEALKSAYRDLSKKYHPDRGGSNQVMAGINALYERLEKLWEDPLF